MADISQGTVYVTAEQLTGVYFNMRRRGLRGVNIYTLSDLLQVTGEDKWGRTVGGQVQQNLFTLSIDERNQIYRKCSPVYGLVTGRAKRIAGLKWTIKNVNKEQDRMEVYLKQAAELFREWAAPNVKAAMVRLRARYYIRRWLPDVLDDLSNFNQALLRWKARNKIRKEDKSDEIQDWMAEVNEHRTFSEFTEETITDVHVHGSAVWYKRRRAGGLIENIDVLPGGTTLPFRPAFVGGSHAFVQIVNGVPPKIYFRDEITYMTYAPMSGVSYGSVPLEALVNRVAEMLLFEEQAAMKADGTSAPEKLIVLNDFMPYADEETAKGLPVPITVSEQSRIETLVNEPRRNAIRVLTGHNVGSQGQPAVVDLSREATFAAQSDRDEKNLRAVAICFNASNVEINLTGSENTSGRETSETQQESDQAKGWLPVAVSYEEKWNKEILPERWGTDYELDLDKGMSEKEQVALEAAKIQSGSYAVNQVRGDRGDEPYPEPQYDRPPGAGAKQEPPDGSPGNPLNTKLLRGR